MNSVSVDMSSSMLRMPLAVWMPCSVRHGGMRDASKAALSSSVRVCTKGRRSSISRCK